jgi:hypothetical protein
MPDSDVSLPPHKTVAGEGDRPTHGKRAAKAEGFLALLMIALFVTFIHAISRPTGDLLVEGIVLLVLYFSSWLLAISGTRRGRGAGRIAAIVALGILVASAVLVVVTSLRSMTGPPSG